MIIYTQSSEVWRRSNALNQQITTITSSYNPVTFLWEWSALKSNKIELKRQRKHLQVKLWDNMFKMFHLQWIISDFMICPYTLLLCRNISIYKELTARQALTKCYEIKWKKWPSSNKKLPFGVIFSGKGTQGRLAKLDQKLQKSSLFVLHYHYLSSVWSTDLVMGWSVGLMGVQGADMSLSPTGPPGLT